LVLSHHQEAEGAYFIATIKNETEGQVADWAIQLDVPPLLVKGLHQSGYVPEESDKRRAVFRSEATQPLWHGASVPSKVQYQLNEANRGMRTFNVRAMAFVGGKLVAEQIRGVDELSGYFLPVVVARRQAMADLMAQATQPGISVPKAQATVFDPAVTPAPAVHDDEAKVLLETWLSDLAEDVHSNKVRSPQVIAPAEIAKRAGVPEAKVVSLLAAVAWEHQHFGVKVKQLQGGKFHLDIGPPRVRIVRGRGGFGPDGWEE
jgi:hypothetical protein